MQEFVTHYGVQCYGKLEEDSNIDVVCENEWNDGVWCDRDPDVQKNWRDVVNFLKENYSKDIQQLTAI